jgi:hypothetical protein
MLRAVQARRRLVEADQQLAGHSDLPRAPIRNSGADERPAGDHRSAGKPRSAREIAMNVVRTDRETQEAAAKIVSIADMRRRQRGLKNSTKQKAGT